MEPEKQKSLKLSGKGEAGGGVFDAVAISGSGRVAGDLEAKTVSISGSGLMEGRVKAEEFESAGKFEIGRDLTAQTVRVSGAGEVDGGVETGTLKVSGALNVGGSVRAREAAISGFLECGGNLESERLQLTGAFDVDGSVLGQQVRIALAGASQASRIAAKELSVLRAAWHWRPLDLLWWRRALLTADAIEGDDIHLEATHASSVRGRKVRLGPGCRIGSVEYSESLQVDPQARVVWHSSTSSAGAWSPVDYSPVKSPGGWAGSERPESLSRLRVQFGKSEIHHPVFKVAGVAFALLTAALLVAFVLFVVLPVLGFVVGCSVAGALVALLAALVGIPLLAVAALLVMLVFMPIRWALRRA